MIVTVGEHHHELSDGDIESLPVVIAIFRAAHETEKDPRNFVGVRNKKLEDLAGAGNEVAAKLLKQSRTT